MFLKVSVMGELKAARSVSDGDSVDVHQVITLRYVFERSAPNAYCRHSRDFAMATDCHWK